MAGRKSTIPLSNMKVVVQIHKDTFVKSVPSVSHKVYDCIQKQLAELFNYHMKKPAIQMSIKRHYNFFFDNIENIPTLEHYFDDSDEKDVDITDESDEVQVKFLMDYHEYRNIEPTNHKLLKNNWTNELQDQIWAKTDLQCTFSFKSNYVPSNLKLNNIKCDGKCTQCGANILVTIDPITTNFIDVTCLISRYKKDFVHDSTIKNKLNSVRKQKLAVILKHNRALAVRAMMADNIIGINEPSEPPTFPKLSTLRRIRHEVKRALQFDKNTILSIYAMSQSHLILLFKNLV
ncbi:hypothetical protein HF086_005577 [Spodoptera exigua]|uniref:Uncharacterized protein n=1 Tax=Spodoptera exigua TaxID=7107 RepID=A0A922SNJ0_SPOEX|nr:hypothetical protein HF086_005577 [Spodoptera exigua]